MLLDTDYDHLERIAQQHNIPELVPAVRALNEYADELRAKGDTAGLDLMWHLLNLEPRTN